MRMISVGCDPGQTGALAVLKDGKIVMLADMPVSARLHGSGQQVDGSELASILRGAIMLAGDNPVAIFLEAVSAMPKQGGSSMFRFGESVGVILGVAGALGIPINWRTPQRWKKEAGLLGKDKDAARTLAIQLHPEVAGDLTRKKDVGRADAICIAHFSMDK